MAEDVAAEDARLRRDGGDLPHPIAEEEVDRRIQIRALRADAVEDGVELGVEAGEQVAIEDAFDDDAAVLVKGGDDAIGRRAGVETWQRGGHVFSCWRSDLV